MLIIVSIASITAALYLLRPAMSALAYTPRVGNTTLEMLPWVFHEPSVGNRLSLSVPVHWYTPRTWRVVPDDELVAIQINGHNVPLDSIHADALHDWGKGFEFDFSPWLTNGNNVVTFELNNRGGDGGITFRPVDGKRWVILWLAFLPWLYLLSRVIRLPRYQTVIIALALAVICNYWSITPWISRTHDVWGVDSHDGHIDYVIRIAHTLSLPGPNEKWELFQPPLYYIGGAIVWRWAEWLHLSPPEAVQAYSLLLWIIFLVGSGALINIVLRDRRVAAGFAIAAVAFWPSGIISSVCINNDVGFYACASLATLFMVRWWRSNKASYLLLASLFAALGLIAKSTALVLVATLGLLMLLRMVRHQRWCRWQPWKAYLSSATIILIGFSLGIGRKLFYYWNGSVSNWLTGDNATFLGDWLKVPAKVGNFIPLDLATFLSYPWADLTNDAHGRNNFWNLLLRTSLTGEYSFSGVMQERIAFLWGGLLVILLAILASQWKRLRTHGNAWRYAPLLIISMLWLASLISFRIQVSYSCNNDFRYLLPILVPFSIACATSGTIARICLVAVALGSTLFFATLGYGP
ncbi:MAG TPA: glycosyltransferase family 39 protein [Steroidobacteraceae bacterium]|nr:glycosyltransferase family 39 protein [Steroidobacteraceae bacterium]